MKVNRHHLFDTPVEVFLLCASIVSMRASDTIGGSKSSGGAGRHLHGNLHCDYEDSAHTRANQQSWRIPCMWHVPCIGDIQGRYAPVYAFVYA